jgi:hypothetical protein
VLTLLGMFIVFMRALKAANPGPLANSAEARALAAAGLTDELLPGAATRALPAPDPAQLEERRARAIDMASKDPAGAALILSRWLSSGEDVKVGATGGGG